MFLRAYAAAFLICLFGFAACAQDVPPAPPLTPAQQREKNINIYDPLDKSNPAAPTPDAATPDPAAAPPAAVQTPVAPLPGSAAASNSLTPQNPRHSGPQVVTDDPEAGVAQDYAGPAVLSRSYTISRPMVPEQIHWTPSLGVSEIYDTGLTGRKLNADGSLQNIASFGTAYRWAFTGRHFWKHDQIGLDYNGNYTRYGVATTYNGSNQLLNLDYEHEFSRRMSLNLVESGSITSQGNSLIDQAAQPGMSVANMDLAASPSTEILDQGMRQFTTMVDLTYKHSARLSVDLGGGFFAVERTGLGFFGNTGYQSKADVNYRYTRKLTIGAYYSFVDYTFTQHVEISNINTFGGILSYSLGRTTQLRTRAGVARAESEGLTSVPIDPSIAALIGRSSVIVDQYRLAYFTDLSGELVKDFGRRRTANLSYARGISPGNGVLMTSLQETESGAFSMLLLHRYAANATAGHTKLSSASQTIGTYGTTFVNFSVGRTYSHGMGLNFQVDYRRFTLTDAPVLHSQLRLSTGISWGPGEGRLW